MKNRGINPIPKIVELVQGWKEVKVDLIMMDSVGRDWGCRGPGAACV